MDLRVLRLQWYVGHIDVWCVPSKNDAPLSIWLLNEVNVLAG